MMKLLNSTLEEITGLDQDKIKEARERLNSLTKPPGSLGKLEELAAKLAGIQGNIYPRIKNKAHILLAADHGVAAEGVSAVPQEITAQMVENFLDGGAAINVLSRQAGADLKVIDIGVARDIEREGLINRKIRYGTANLCREAAMTEEEAVSSLEVGIEIARETIAEGVELLGVGEMGIANTTSSSAILAVLGDYQLDEIVGYGSGISSEKLNKKKQVIREAIKINQPDPGDGLDVLTKVGGLEIGGMAGVMLGAAAESVPVIVDGFISGAAALLAYKLEPKMVDYLISSHESEEPGHRKIFDFLGMEPMLQLNMRLGEGTGAVLAMSLVEAAGKIISEMATFADLKMDTGEMV